MVKTDLGKIQRELALAYKLWGLHDRLTRDDHEQIAELGLLFEQTPMSPRDIESYKNHVLAIFLAAYYPRGKISKSGDSTTTWDNALTLETWFRKGLQEGRDEEVLAIMEHIPEERKKRFREIWKEEKKS